MKFSEYATWTPDKLLVRLCEITDELCRVWPEIALTKAQDLRDKQDVYMSNPLLKSVTERANLAKFSTTVTTASLYELEAEELCLKEEKYLIQRLLDHHAESR